MRKYLFVLFALAIFASCKKHGVSPINIIGKWELAKRYGGNINPPDTTYKAGNGNILQFNSDGSYKQITGGTLTASGAFQINGDHLFFDPNLHNGHFYDVISISGNMLTIQPTMPDIGTTVYDKISN
jgi:hypothetical protein